MLVQAATYKRRKDKLGETKIISMIKSALSAGIQLDHHQIKLLTPIDTMLVQDLIKQYKSPRWKKACSTKADLPLDVRKDLIGIDLDPSRESCKVLESLYSKDKDEIMAALIRRKGNKLSADLQSIDQYIGKDKPSVPMISNQSLLSHRAGDYGDMYEVHYHDNTGNWSFTYDMFDDLLDSKENPVTLQPLPEKILASISFRSKMLIDLGIREPKTITESFNSLWADDDIGKKVNHDETYISELNRRGIFISESALRSLKAKQISLSLKGLGLNNNIDRLDNDHAVSTLIWILEWADPSLSRTIVGELNIIGV
jgi:hypothetical protein